MCFLVGDDKKGVENRTMFKKRIVELFFAILLIHFILSAISNITFAYQNQITRFLAYVSYFLTFPLGYLFLGLNEVMFNIIFVLNSVIWSLVITSIVVGYKMKRKNTNTIK